MKTNIQYNKEKEGLHSPMSYLKSFLLAVVFTTAALNVHANDNNIFKSDTSEIDSFKLSEEAEMELEAWMLDVELFRHFIMDRKTGDNPCKHITKADEEKELPLETWMLAKELFFTKFKNVEIKKTPVAEYKTME